MSEALGDVELQAQAFNAGPGGGGGDLQRGARRELHRSEPGDQRVLPVGGSGDPHRRRHDLGRSRAHRERGHHLARAAGGTDLATPQLGNTQDVALRAWLARAGIRDRPRGRRRRLDHAAGQRPGAGGVHRRRHRRGVGPRAVVDANGRGRRRSCARRRGGPVAGRPVRDDAPHRRDRVPGGASGRRARRCSPATSRR